METSLSSGTGLSVITRTVQQIGGSFGTAVLAVILSAALTARHGDLAAGFDVAFWWATGFSALAVLLSLWLPAAPRAGAVPPPGAVPQPEVTSQPEVTQPLDV